MAAAFRSKAIESIICNKFILNYIYFRVQKIDYRMEINKWMKHKTEPISTI